MAKHTTVSIRYQIAQKVRSWRLKRKYTLKDLVGKTGINYHTLLIPIPITRQTDGQQWKKSHNEVSKIVEV